ALPTFDWTQGSALAFMYTAVLATASPPLDRAGSPSRLWLPVAPFRVGMPISTGVAAAFGPLAWLLQQPLVRSAWTESAIVRLLIQQRAAPLPRLMPRRQSLSGPRR